MRLYNKILYRYKSIQFISWSDWLAKGKGYFREVSRSLIFLDGGRYFIWRLKPRVLPFSTLLFWNFQALRRVYITSRMKKSGQAYIRGFNHLSILIDRDTIGQPIPWSRYSLYCLRLRYEEPPFRSTTEIMFAHTSPSLPWPIDRTSPFLSSARSSGWPMGVPLDIPASLGLAVKIARIRTCAWTRTRSTDSFNPLTVGTIISRGNWRCVQKQPDWKLCYWKAFRDYFAFISPYFVRFSFLFHSYFLFSLCSLISLVIFHFFLSRFSAYHFYYTSGASGATYICARYIFHNCSFIISFVSLLPCASKFHVHLTV